MSILVTSFATRVVSVNALGIPNVSDTTVNVGDTIIVFGATNDVTSGSEVKVFWDIATGPSAWLLNTTTGNPDGSYEFEIIVPATPSGAHYLWVESVSTGEVMRSDAIAVSPTINLDPEEGLPGDNLTLDGTGFDDEARFNVSFFNATTKYDVIDLADNEETDEYGSFSVAITVPSGWNKGDYLINVSDGSNYNLTVAFTIKSIITLTPNRGPEGSVVTIEGRGFDDVILNETDIAFFNWHGLQIVNDGIDVNGGTFEGEVIIPSYGIGDWNITVNDGTNVAMAAFEIDGESTVHVDPVYGAPGAIITVNGYNFTQIVGEEITLDLTGTALGEVDTNADGTWTTTFTVPAVGFGQYLVNATTAEDGVNATDNFKVGIIAIIISPTSGPAGTEVTLTGTGFAQGKYNASFGDETVIELGTVSAGETLSDTFLVPSVDDGTYNVTVVDDALNECTTTFTVTGETSLTPTPSDVAIGYNVSLYGEYFAEQNETTIVWYVYNSTDTLNITDLVNYTGMDNSIMVSGDGNFTGVWTVSDWLLLGNTYTVNATDAEGLYAETTLTIIEEGVVIEPNTRVYVFGDTITFTIKATEAIGGSVLEIVDHDGELVFISTFAPSDWDRIAGWDVVRVVNQVVYGSMNPYIIPSDGVEGKWVWTLYEDATEDAVILQNGTIMVLPTIAAQVGSRLSTYRPEDTVAFTINTTVVKTDAYLTISDPSGHQYWISTFNEADWVSVGDFHVVPFNRQIDDNNGRELTLPIGAVNGIWSWILKSEVEEIIALGNFSVADEGSSSPLTEFTLNVSAGWNMVSIPFLPQDPSAASVLSDVSFYQLVTWSGSGYVVATEFELGKGYWLLVLEDISVTITG